MITYELSIINGESAISLRIVDYLVNFANKNFTVYNISKKITVRFKV